MALANEYFRLTRNHQEELGEKTIIFMQVGAFYEIYALKNPDTLVLTGSPIEDFSKRCECAVVNKQICIGVNNVVMAGFRDYNVDKYIKKMQDIGYSCAIYSQDANCKNTTRSLEAIYSPGTFFSVEDDKITNNIMCLWVEKMKKSNMIYIGVSSIDIYTGSSYINEISHKYVRGPTTYDELEKIISIYSPSETIIIYRELTDDEITDLIQFSNIFSSSIHKIDLNDKTIQSKKANNCENQIYQRELFLKFWDISDINVFFESGQFNEYPITTQSLCYLLDFINLHNPNLIHKINEPVFQHSQNNLVLANHSLKQLNLISDNKRQFASVSNFINACITSMGKRSMNYAICNPITNINKLNDIYDFTDELLNKYNIVETTRRQLMEICDIEKIFRKLILSKLTPQDLYKISTSISIVSSLQVLFENEEIFMKSMNDELRNHCETLSNFIHRFIDLDIASKIDNLNFDENFFNANIYKKLDDNEHKLEELMDKLLAIQEHFCNIISQKDKGKNKDKTMFVKLSKTEQNGYYLQATSRRLIIMKEYIKNKKNLIVPYRNTEIIIPLDAANVMSFATATSTGQKIVHPFIDNICREINKLQIMQKAINQRKLR